MKRSPGRARSHMTTKPVSATLQTPLALKARDSHTSSKVWPRFGKYDDEEDFLLFFSLLGFVVVVVVID